VKNLPPFENFLNLTLFQNILQTRQWKAGNSVSYFLQDNYEEDGGLLSPGIQHNVLVQDKTKQHANDT
jgi:hypothetical protein